MFNLKLYEHEKQINRLSIPILLLTVFFTVLAAFTNTSPFLFFLWALFVLSFLALKQSIQEMKNYTLETIKNNSFFLFLLSSEKTIEFLVFILIIFPIMIIPFYLITGIILEIIIVCIINYCLLKLFDFFDVYTRIAVHFQLKIKED